MIKSYQEGKVVNHELEPRYDAFPDDAPYPVVESIDDFELQEGSDMYAVCVLLEAGDYTMRLGVSPFGRSATLADEAAGGSSIRWLVVYSEIFPTNVLSQNTQEAKP